MTRSIMYSICIRHQVETVESRVVTCEVISERAEISIESTLSIWFQKADTPFEAVMYY
jgi:hypothetical protein